MNSSKFANFAKPSRFPEKNGLLPPEFVGNLSEVGPLIFGGRCPRRDGDVAEIGSSVSTFLTWCQVRNETRVRDISSSVRSPSPLGQRFSLISLSR